MIQNHIIQIDMNIQIHIKKYSKAVKLYIMAIQ